MTIAARPHRHLPAAAPCLAPCSGLDADVCLLCQRLAQLIDPQEFAFVCEHDREPAHRAQATAPGARHARFN